MISSDRRAQKAAARPATSWRAARSPTPVAEIVEDPGSSAASSAIFPAMQKADDMERNNKFV
jgi:predicted PhzF superfamily epimerase YddE/YHI9